MTATETAAARNEYRANRASCTRHNAARFDELAQRIARELCDGEEMTAAHWVQASRILASGQDYA